MYQLITQEELKTTRWSGGTTTQLAIYPPLANYSKRNFQWRLSSAVVEDPTSTFTTLPGVARILLILEGSLQLHHAQQGDYHLNTYQQNSFWGDWHTTSQGKVTDFNLMLAQGMGRVEVQPLQPNQPWLFQSNTFPDLNLYHPHDRKAQYQATRSTLAHTEAFYFPTDANISLTYSNQELHVTQGDVFILTHAVSDPSYPLSFISDTATPIIYTSIIYTSIIHTL